MIQFRTLLESLHRHEVHFVIVGGIAATLHGSETLRKGLNFTLTTSDGPIDLLGEVSGVGTYRAAREQAVEARFFEGTYFFLDLDPLIASKRAAGRPKDFEAIAELEAIREERRSSS